MAYKLELPTTSWVHQVFHVSWLNKVIGDKISIQTILPKLDEERKIILEHEAVIETRTRELWNQSISEYLIKWKNLQSEVSTWEDKNFIQRHPKLLSIEDNAFLKERGILGPYNTSVFHYYYSHCSPLLLFLCSIEAYYCYCCALTLLLLFRL